MLHLPHSKHEYSQLSLSRIRISRIITLVKGLFKSSSLYILLFLTLHKSKLFLQSQQIRLRQSWLYFLKPSFNKNSNQRVKKNFAHKFLLKGLTAAEAKTVA